jgi:uncharacterized protein YbcV (DUF1398 family)
MTADEAAQMQRVEAARRKADRLRHATAADNMLAELEGRANIYKVIYEARHELKQLIEDLRQ